MFIVQHWCQSEVTAPQFSLNTVSGLRVQFYVHNLKSRNRRSASAGNAGIKFLTAPPPSTYFFKRKLQRVKPPSASGIANYFGEITGVHWESCTAVAPVDVKNLTRHSEKCAALDPSTPLSLSLRTWPPPAYFLHVCKDAGDSPTDSRLSISLRKSMLSVRA